jgi:hypothetical protein
MISSTLAGVAGEYFVAAELSRRGLVASISLRNTRGIDIQVSDSLAASSVTIQCKTSRANKKNWILRDTSEKYHSKTHFYIFVTLGDILTSPEYHIVPSKIVADYIRKSHKAWMKRLGKNGQPHKDSSMRRFADYEDAYLNRWDYLGFKLSEA